MPTTETKKPETPQDLFEKQIRKETRDAADRLAGRDYHEEIRALERDDDNVHNTATGRMIMRHGRIRGNNGHGHLENLRHAFAMGGLLDATKSLMDGIIDLARTATYALAPHSPETANHGISSTFGNRVKPNRNLQPHHEDDDYIYDAMFVSQDVFDKLMKESDEIATRVEELKALKDPEIRREMSKIIERMAEDFEMRLHPVTQIYVHDFNRVLREESACTTNATLRREFPVCVYLHKSQHDDIKGIKAKIGDPYNEDPREAIAAGDHLKGANPAPPPAIKGPYA